MNSASGTAEAQTLDEKDAELAFLRAEVARYKRLLTEHYEGRARLQKRMEAHARKVHELSNANYKLTFKIHQLENPGAPNPILRRRRGMLVKESAVEA